MSMRKPVQKIVPGGGQIARSVLNCCGSSTSKVSTNSEFEDGLLDSIFVFGHVLRGESIKAAFNIFDLSMLCPRAKSIHCFTKSTASFSMLCLPLWTCQIGRWGTFASFFRVQSTVQSAFITLQFHISWAWKLPVRAKFY